MRNLLNCWDLRVAEIRQRLMWNTNVKGKYGLEERRRSEEMTEKVVQLSVNLRYYT